MYEKTEPCKRVRGCSICTAFSTISMLDMSENVGDYGIHHEVYAGALGFIRSEPDDSMTPNKPK
jgi:hypothetical protein